MKCSFPNRIEIKKALKVSLIFIVFSLPLMSQPKDRKWSFEVGVNTVNVRTYTISSDAILKDYFGKIGWSGLAKFGISRIAVQKYVGYGLTLQAVSSINKIIARDDLDAKYISIDILLKRDFKKILLEKKWFHTYYAFGVGRQQIGKESDVVFITGIGVNVLLDERWGFNFQTGYKHGFRKTGRDVFQHSICLVYHFSASDIISRGRLWN
jgi:hypothetical protein